MLKKMGFEYLHEIDPFDGGPKVSAHIDRIPIIHKSRVAIVGKIEKTKKTIYTTIVCNNRCIDFRAIFAQVKRLHNDTVAISEECADALKIEIGDTIRYSTIQQD